MKECAEAAAGPDTSGSLSGFLKHYCGRSEKFSPVICLPLLPSACLAMDSELCFVETEHPWAGRSSRRAKRGSPSPWFKSWPQILLTQACLNRLNSHKAWQDFIKFLCCFSLSRLLCTKARSNVSAQLVAKFPLTSAGPGFHFRPNIDCNFPSD